MNPPLAAGLGVAVAAAVSCMVSNILVRCGPVDAPRDRGLHVKPTPTSGGLGIICGAAAGLLLFEAIYPGGQFASATAEVFGLAALLGLFGALDDIFDIDAKIKLIVQLAVAVAFAVFVAHPAALPWPGGEVLLPPVIGMGGTALWVVVVINTVNFMDGSNGLVAGSLAIAAGALGLAAMSADFTPVGGVALIVLGGAALGFLPTNFPRAQVFMGDAGAQFLGALLAMLAVVVAGDGGQRAAVNLLAAPIALTPLLTDVFLTLIVRARRGSRLFDAHREHLYQRWFLARGESHGAVAARVWGVTGLYSILALVASQHAPALAWPALIAGVVASVGGWLLIGRRLAKG